MTTNTQPTRASTHNANIGRTGEDIAAQFLEDQGYLVIERNWRCPEGEIDIIARRGSLVALVEVKTRTTSRFGGPLAALTAIKLARMRRVAGVWLSQTQEYPGSVRLDAIAVAMTNGTVAIDHRQGIA